MGGVTTKYLVDTLNPTHLPQVLDETVNGSVTRTYAYGLQRISENQLVGSTWTPGFYGYDGHGNVRLLTNTSGTVTDTYQYDAFGMPIASTGTTANNYLYSGEQFDSSVGWYQLRQRWYREAVGRFITRDPVEGAACFPLTYNPYVYGVDDPVANVDPTGEQAIEYLLLYIWIQGYKPPLPSNCVINTSGNPNPPSPTGGITGGTQDCSYYDQRCCSTGRKDSYACRAGQCCRDFGEGKKQSCVRECLIERDKVCVKDHPNSLPSCRFEAHVACYTKCRFIPGHVPKSCRNIALGR